MKKIQFIITALAIGFLAACSSPETEETARQELEALRQQQRDLTQKIKESEKKLASLANGDSELMREPVVLQHLEPTTFKHFFEASGSVIPVDQAFISPEVNGQIMHIYVEEGDRVKKGQLLAKLNTEVTEKSIVELETSLVLAMDVYERQKRLWEQKIGSEMQFLEAKNNKNNLQNRLETMKAQLDMSLIYAPIDGIIEKVNQKKGELAIPGAQLMQLVNLKEIYVRADISESFLPSIKTGDEVSLKFPAYPEYQKSIKISRIGNVINKNNRTFEIELRFENENEMLKPNMIAVIEINDFTAENSLIIPSKVIKEDLNGRYLYVAAEENDELIGRKRYVEIGRTYGNMTRVTKGLKPGEQVVTEGFNRITDGSFLKKS